MAEKVTEYQDRIGRLADKIDNYLVAISLPMTPEFHLKQLKIELEEVSKELKAIYKEITGESPWEM